MFGWVWGRVMENGIRHTGVKIYPQGVLKQRAISVVKSKTSKQADFLEHKGHAGAHLSGT